MLNGGKVANEWQPMSAEICVGPISRCVSLIAANTGRSGQPGQKFGGGGGGGARRRPGEKMRGARRRFAASRNRRALVSEQPVGRRRDRRCINTAGFGVAD